MAAVGSHLEFHHFRHGSDQIDCTNRFLDHQNLGMDTKIASLFQSIQELWVIDVTAAILDAILYFTITNMVMT